jgi:TolA-binding protein
MRNGEYSSAIENFMEFLSLYPGSYYWRFALNRYIQIMYLLNKDDEVERIFSSFENSNISYKNGNYLIGIKADYYRKNNRSSEAFALLNAACAAASDSKTRKRFKF